MGPKPGGYHKLLDPGGNDWLPARLIKGVVPAGAASGIGYETALELARRGAEVVIADKNAKRVRDLTSSLPAIFIFLIILAYHKIYYSKTPSLLKF